MREIAYTHKTPQIVCGWGSAPDPAGGAYTTLPRLLVGWEGDAYDRCSWTFVWTGG